MAQGRTPNSRRHLDGAIDRLCQRTGDNPVRVRRYLANVIVGQLLPEGAVKGGTALKMRFGRETTRYSQDLDTARACELDKYLERLASSLSYGWAGFTGRLVPRTPAAPQGVPQVYVMRPFDVKLEYNGTSWLTVPLEVGHNEIGDADEPDATVPCEAAELCRELGLPAPGPVALMKLEHQIAQKIHAVSSPNSERAHDLVDLQIIAKKGSYDMGSTRDACLRLFAYRKAQTWPPVIQTGPLWEELYAAQAVGLDVLGSVDEAIVWANNLVMRIDAYRDVA